MSLDKVAFLRFNVLIADEISSLVMFLKKNLVFVRYILFYANYAWAIIVARNITVTTIIIKHIYTKIRSNINKKVIESLG